MAKNHPRSAARIRAFQVLYSLQFSPVSSIEELKALAERLPDDTATDAPSASKYDPDFAWDLVQGVWSCEAALDEAIASFSHNWRKDRLGKVELTLLRLAFYELEHHPDVPAKVIISESLELAARFANDQARHFINGILDAAARARDAGAGNAHPSASLR